MCDEVERITKGVGGIRVSCYGPVTLLEHGRMRLRAQHVNKGGGHICKTRRWPHGASGHLTIKTPLFLGKKTFLSRIQNPIKAGPPEHHERVKHM